MCRFSDAYMIQQGACNPSGVARSLVKAIDEAREENPSTAAVCDDPAVRLILHQLSYICRVPQLDHGEGWKTAYDTCKAKHLAGGGRDYD